MASVSFANTGFGRRAYSSGSVKFWPGPSIQVIQVETVDGLENAVRDGRRRHGRKYSAGNLFGVRNQGGMRREKLLKNGPRLVISQDGEAPTLRAASWRLRSRSAR